MAICETNTKPVFSAEIPSEPGNGPIPAFLDLLSKWPTSIPLDNLWSIEFDIPNNAAYQIDEPPLVHGQWKINEIAKNIKNVTKEFPSYKTNMLANSIKLVGEGIDTERVGSINSEGYLRGLVTKGRADFGTLDVAFLETNYSFVDYIIRPWLISIARDGLIARYQNKRTNIYCTMYGLAGKGESLIPRKKFVFLNAFPTNVDEEEYNFTESEVNLRKVSFAFTHYAMMQIQDKGSKLHC